ncbi:membrane protein insertion efficiency factor YidD [Desulfatiglans anilini]|uniref:membrane protein insertion efficiency factor YidD n=1 Tax=Desulfatiglans anilini TaxID=90728 RepID=UPI00040242EF|nr:membrane protein insertion efficiency factor YidD [Desulfatiglans anilini]
MKRRSLMATGVCLGLALWLACSPDAASLAAHPAENPAASTNAADERAGGVNAGAWLVRLFRDHISAVDSNRCPSYPSCSEYSVRAFEKHGFVMGWLMTVDRLIHEGSEEEAVSGTVRVGDRLLINDPVHNNDFWWYRPK